MSLCCYPHNWNKNAPGPRVGARKTRARASGGQGEGAPGGRGAARGGSSKQARKS